MQLEQQIRKLVSEKLKIVDNREIRDIQRKTRENMEMWMQNRIEKNVKETIVDRLFRWGR